MRMRVSSGPFLHAKIQAPEPAEDIAWLYVRGEYGSSTVSKLVLTSLCLQHSSMYLLRPILALSTTTGSILL